MIRIGTQDQAFFPKNILEKFSYIKKLGFASFEIDGQLLVDNLEEVKAAIQETGIPVSTVCNGYDGWIGDFIEERRVRGVSQITKILEAASEVGAKGIVVPAAWGMFTYRLPPMTSPRSTEGDFKAISDSLRTLDDVAGRTGTTIFLEPLNRYQDHMINLLEDARHIIEENQFKHVKIIADFYHMNIEEDDIALALHEQKDLLGHVHLADNHRYQPGSGSLDFKRYFGQLVKDNYDGDLIYECRVRGDKLEEVYQKSINNLNKLLLEFNDDSHIVEGHSK